MPGRIEDYALIGDTQTAALVGRDGSIDWLCVPRFDSRACFAALLGGHENGRWLLAPEAAVRARGRRYRPDTLVLDTEFQTDDGRIVVTDFMPIRDDAIHLVRIVQGRAGRVPVTMELTPRFDYGSIAPWVRRTDDGMLALAGPDGLHLRTDREVVDDDGVIRGRFEIGDGDRAEFVLSWFPSHERPPAAPRPEIALLRTERFWRSWTDRCTYEGKYREAVVRALITLKALTYAPTGGIVAAPTTSLPELIGGERNWDYRYCWLRDGTFTLLSLLEAGYRAEAAAFRDWLLRTVAGDPSKLQIVYGVGGERRLTEIELDWLGGYERSQPVRSGNAAFRQFQLDVYGEVLDLMHQSAAVERLRTAEEWDMELALLDFLESSWQRADEGIWEIRSEPRHFTHSKVMAWVGIDRAVRTWRSATCRGPSTTGGRSATGSTPRCASGGTTRTSAPSSSPTAPATSTRACSGSRSWASCRRTTSASWGRSARSRSTSSATASSPATRPIRTSTACRAARARSSRARSGWRTRTRWPVVTTGRSRSSSACWTSATTWVCSRRSTTPRNGARSATSRRRCRCCRWSPPP